METKQKKKTYLTHPSSQTVPQKKNKKTSKKIQKIDHYPYFYHPFGMRWIWMMG